MIRTEFAAANLRLILGFNYGWWMLRNLLQLKSMALPTQMISVLTRISPLTSWVKLPWINWLIRPSAIVYSPLHAVGSPIRNYRRGLFLLV